MEPVTWSGAVSGADSKAAVWPGMSMGKPPPAGPADPEPPDGPEPVDEPSAPRPGKTDIDGGAPPGGLTTSCGGPDRPTIPCPAPRKPREPRAPATPRSSPLL